MPYQANDLSALNYANGFTLWHYKTTDGSDVVDGVGYFNEANNMLRIGDFLFVNTSTDTVANHGVMVVVGNSDGLVDVSNIVNFGIINSD